MKKMRKNQILALVLFTLLAYRARSVTVDEVESIKREFDKEVKAMEDQAELKGLKDSNSKKANDPAIQEVVSDLIKHDIENSLKTLNNNEDVDQEKAAFEFHSEFAKDEKKNENNVDQEKAAFEFLTELTKDEKKNENAFKREAMTELEKLEKKEVETKSQKGKCKDRVGRKRCKLLATRCHLPKLKARMRRYCEETCGYCRNCEDIWPSGYCRFISKQCEVPKQKRRMKQNCKATCGYCKKCEDTWPRDYCRAISKQCKVPKQKRRMKQNCKATCGYCKSKFPPACQNSPFGCCWDNTTKKSDKHGLNCPVCANKYKKLCQTLSGFCGNSKFMKQNCPRSCGFCHECEKSRDKVSYEGLCRSWLKKKFCNVLDIRLEYCKYTCNCVWPQSLPKSEYIPTPGSSPQ